LKMMGGKTNDEVMNSKTLLQKINTMVFLSMPSALSVAIHLPLRPAIIGVMNYSGQIQKRLIVKLRLNKRINNSFNSVSEICI
ncbi:MAG: hypothetical protein JXL67_13595, partial [Calditrichaeota bacterium]|nr:hypothetical protein [Calditrichota bacterium]